MTTTEKKAKARVKYLTRRVREYERLVSEYPDDKYAERWRNRLAEFRAKLETAQEHYARKRASGIQYRRMMSAQMIAVRDEMNAVRASLWQVMQDLNAGKITPRKAKAMAKAANRRLRGSAPSGEADA